MTADCAFARGETVMLPDAIRRHVVIGRQIFRAFAGRDDAEAGWRGAQSTISAVNAGLVAIGGDVDHAGPARFLGEQGAPASTSASTLTITICLPAAIAARALLDADGPGCRSPPPPHPSRRPQWRARRRR